MSPGAFGLRTRHHFSECILNRVSFEIIMRRGIARVRDWLNMRSAIGRTWFGVAQLLSLSMSGALFPRHSLSKLQEVAFIGGTTAVFLFWGIMTAKRLLDIGWSRAWAMLALAPAAAWMLQASPQSRTAASSGIVLTLGILSVLYLLLTILLVLLPGRTSGSGGAPAPMA